MIVHKEDLIKHITDPDLRSALADHLNKKIQERCTAVTGTKLKNGVMKNFGSEQDPSDVHVGLLLGVVQMGIEPPEEIDLAEDTTSLEEENAALKAKIAEMEKMKAQRGK